MARSVTGQIRHFSSNRHQYFEIKKFWGPEKNWVYILSTCLTKKGRKCFLDLIFSNLYCFKHAPPHKILTFYIAKISILDSLLNHNDLLLGIVILHLKTMSSLECVGKVLYIYVLLFDSIDGLKWLYFSVLMSTLVLVNFKWYLRNQYR